VSYVEEGYSGGQCESPKTQVNVNIVPLPENPSAITSDVRRCGTGMVTLEVWGHYDNFQWYDANDNALSGATSASYSFQLDQLNDEQVHKVRGINGEGCESGLTVISATAVADCENYVHDLIINVRGVTSEAQLISLTADEKAETWNYLDGMGRPMQAIGMQASPDLKDVIKVFKYDDLGREAESVLSYRSTQSDGKYRTTALTEIFTYYTGTNKGLVANNKSRILGTSEWLETSYFYDKYHNNVYTVTKETSSGSRSMRYLVENLYDPVSNELEKQITTVSTGEDELSFVKRFAYDHGGRILKEYYSIREAGLQPEVIGASFEYNELGQLVNKKIHSADNGSTWLQSQDYTYNIRGALTSLNNLTGDLNQTDYFGFDMAFENAIPNAGNMARYDGMVSAVRWNDDLTSKENLYNFDYDGLNRLTSSVYKKGFRSMGGSE
jgi:hypothetical protein